MDFTCTFVAALNKCGVFFVGSTWIPDAEGVYGERAYNLDDNGTHRVRSYAEVKAMEGAS